MNFVKTLREKLLKVTGDSFCLQYVSVDLEQFSLGKKKIYQQDTKKKYKVP